MLRCPGCGSQCETDATHCWECYEPLASRPEPDPSAASDWFDDEDDPASGDDLLDGVTPSAQRPNGRTPAESDVLDEASFASELPAPSLEPGAGDGDGLAVAFEAQDEVQAGTISQLLTDSGIHNVAYVPDETTPDGVPRMQVQVLQADLDRARMIIADFTALFEEPAD